MEYSFADPGVVERLMVKYGELTRNAIYSYLPTGRPQQHLYDLIADYPVRGGRLMRSSLCIAIARAFGAPIEDVLPTAVSVELLHNALLIHDDIEDDSDNRRGKPTLHKQYGIPLALNAGDALSVLSFEPLLDNIDKLGLKLGFALVEESIETARKTVEGQAIELGWRRDNEFNITQADYLDMIMKKTCWYTSIFPCRAGALIGGWGTEIELDDYIPFGTYLGAVFQIQDDILNLIGDEQKYGKENAGDILEGKRTLMLIHLMENGDESMRSRLTDVMATEREERTPEDVAWIVDSMHRLGSIEHAIKFARDLAAEAYTQEFQKVFGHLPASSNKEFIREVVLYALNREH